MVPPDQKANCHTETQRRFEVGVSSSTATSWSGGTNQLAMWIFVLWNVYMCSRFFYWLQRLIATENKKLDAYLANHFSGEEDLKYEYLMTLSKVVDESTICLMGHERRQTLNLIQQLACEILIEQEQKAQSKYLQLPQFDNLNNLILDQVFYGPYNTSTGNGPYYSYLPFYQMGKFYLSPYVHSPILQCS